MAVNKTPFSANDIDAVFFDLDGTLMDSDDESVASWERRFFRARMRRERASGFARAFVMFLETPVNFSITVADWFGLDAPYVRLIARLQGEDQHAPPPPVDGAAALLDNLAGRYKLAVASTRSEAEGLAFVESINATQYIQTIVGRDSVQRIKPHPQPLHEAARRLNVPIERCLMVGDTTPDVRAARRAGAWSVAVLCGFGERRELERAGAHVVLDHTKEVEDLLRA